MSRLRLLAALLALLAGLTASAVRAQEPADSTEADDEEEPFVVPPCYFRGGAVSLPDRAAPLDSTAIDLGEGRVKLCYGRPSVNPGDPVFGALVPWGELWRAGANEATHLYTDVPVTVAGIELEPGPYTLYAEPGPDRWRVYLSRAANRWGLPITGVVRGQQEGSISVTPDTLPLSIDTLTFSLTAFDEESAELTMTWDRVRWSVPIRLAPPEEEEQAEGAEGRGAPNPPSPDSDDSLARSRDVAMRPGAGVPHR